MGTVSKDAIRRINRRLGYRLLPSRVDYPKEVKIGEFFEVAWTLQNVGVAPCYDGGFVSLTLEDAQGGIVALNGGDYGAPALARSEAKFYPEANDARTRSQIRRAVRGDVRTQVTTVFVR